MIVTFINRSKFLEKLVNFLYLSCIRREPAFAYAKTKMQISFAVSAKLISAFVFPTIPLRPKSKFAILWPSSVAVHAARLVLDLVGNPVDRFSCNASHLSTATCRRRTVTVHTA